MSIVSIKDVRFINNPARFLDPYHFHVTFECMAHLKDDLEWKLIYVSSPDNMSLDQELDDCLVGPVPVGVSSFEFQGSAPLPNRIPPKDVLGVAALILTGSYNDQEFVRVGYYQNTEYDNEEMQLNPPEAIQFERLIRNLSDKPRVTRFHIKWDVAPQPVAQTAVQAGPAQSAAVPSANDYVGANSDRNPNGVTVS
ncbi:hypothetical protein Clacol_003524 [Clathrus columnatus]|uniref:Anti-silencing function protein 1 n=1 Tax=Clathrus columnatus TaxID=1419009 RepID=A0AAV5A3Y0_9AGAM|nr:hypothetical protein Clacol_003524 [Clathrus columnatus]